MPRLAEMMPTPNLPFYITDGSKGVALNVFTLDGQKPDDLVLTNPDAVVGLHKAYMQAGADIIQTASFTLNSITRPDLKPDMIVYMNNTAAKLAKSAIGTEKILVAGSIGPLGGEIFESMGGKLTHEVAVTAYQQQMMGLTKGGVDIFNVETLLSIESVNAALEAGFLANTDMGTKIPLVITMSFGKYFNNKGFRTDHGVTPVRLIQAIKESKHQDTVFATGANCGLGYHEVTALVSAFKAEHMASDLWIKLNAGIPNQDGIYVEATPDSASMYAATVFKEGAKFIGGCCGTTPGLIEAMKTSLQK